MRLTERQCWKIIRNMVADKNEEYRKLLNNWFDDMEKIRDILGFTRDTFLEKMHFSSHGAFNDYLKREKGKAYPNWLENLSCEDLVLFLDYRCRALQSMYNYYNTNDKISKFNIQTIALETPVSSLKGWNRGRLSLGAKPPRINGEKKLETLEQEYSLEDLREMALTQVLKRMADYYVIEKGAKETEAMELANKIRTYNITHHNEKTGFEFRGDIDVSYEETERPKFVGLTIQGTPVYYKEGEYKTSTGEMLEEGVFIKNNEGDFIL